MAGLCKFEASLVCIARFRTDDFLWEADVVGEFLPLRQVQSDPPPSIFLSGKQADLEHDNFC